jgi:DnaJ-class molecular chaperone
MAVKLMMYRCFYATVAATGSSPTYYDILNVSREATKKHIKEQFYHLSKKYHPDKHQGSLEAHQKFQQLNEAYSVLIDSQKRQLYDQTLFPPLQRPLNQSKRTPHSSPRSPPSQASINYYYYYCYYYGSDAYRWSSSHEARYAQDAMRQEEHQLKSTMKGKYRGTTVSPFTQQEERHEQETPSPMVESVRIWHLMVLLGCVGCGMHLAWKMRT